MKCPKIGSSINLLLTLLYGLVLMSASVVSQAQVQRAGLQAQTIRLSPSGQSGASAQAKAFCLDQSVPGPKADNYYRQVLHGRDHAYVVIGKKKMSLSDAVAEGKIQIRGQNLVEREARQAELGARRLAEWRSGEPLTNESADSLPLSIDNLTAEEVSVVVERPMAMAADDWLEGNEKTRLTPEAWRLVSKSLSEPIETGALPSWQWTTPAIIWQSMTSRGIKPEVIRQFFGLTREGGMQADVLGKLDEYSPEAELVLGDEPAWLLTHKKTKEKFVLHGGGGKPPRKTGGKGNQLPDGNGEEFGKTPWKDFRAIYAAQQKMRLENLSQQHSVDFVVIDCDMKKLRLVTGQKSIDLDNLPEEEFSKALRYRDSRPLILVRDQANWAPDKRNSDDVVDRLRDVGGENLELYVDDNPEVAIANLRARPTIRVKEDIAVYEGGFVDGRGNELKHLCEEWNLTHIGEGKAKGEPTVVTASNLIIVSAHKNSDYRNYLMDLADRGALKGKALLLVSCGAKTDGAFVNELLTRSQAHVALRFTTEILATDAAVLIRHIGKELEQPLQKGERLEALVRKALDAMIEEAVTQDAADALAKMKRFLIQIS